MITQAELEEIQAYRVLAARMKDRTAEIRLRVAAGEEVETGALSAQVCNSESRRWSLAAVASVIGADEADRLSRQLPPTSVSRLLIANAERQESEPRSTRLTHIRRRPPAVLINGIGSLEGLGISLPLNE